MRIIVCIKQVADTEASIQISADGKSIVETGVKFIMNPYDEFAVEEALRIKETGNESLVKVIGVGPERTIEALRSACAMGADEVLLLKTEAPVYDALALAGALADAIKKEPFDLILLGKETIDDGNGEIGPMLAEMLQIPCMTVITRLKVQGGLAVAEREGEKGIEGLTAPLPLVITCQKGLNEPRYPSIRGVMAAKKREIPVQPAVLTPAAIEVHGLALPAQRQAGRVIGEGAAAVPELIRLLKEEAKVL
ncbi:MAG TPA: electron transfer flavoprotein subunit beta/FixA family protein [bacterium]|nr:electron transfer flavoprotein subunit beta/FixA family protein [bacterium]